MVLCLFVYFLAVNFDWSIILIRKSFGASRHISGKLGVKLVIMTLKPSTSDLTKDHCLSHIMIKPAFCIYRYAITVRVGPGEKPGGKVLSQHGSTHLAIEASH